MSSRIYILSWPVNVLCTTSKRPRLDNVDDSYLWYCRLGHINKNRINKLIKEDLLKISDYESLPIYESCHLGKIIKSLFIEKGERVNELLSGIY